MIGQATFILLSADANDKWNTINRSLFQYKARYTPILYNILWIAQAADWPAGGKRGRGGRRRGRRV
jgi:hypothetical protein